MRIKILIILFFSFLMVIFVPMLYTAKEVTQDASLEEFTAYIDKRIPSLMNDYDIPGANIALVQKGKRF